jgi:transposase InsO family protein
LWTAEGKLYMLVAIDRTSKFAFAELHERVTRRVAADFLRRLIATVPYRIHTVLTDNGTHFTDPRGESWTAADVKRLLGEKARFRCHAFVLACAQNDIDHRLTKPNHPWTNGQVERMNRTIKDATVRRYHYDSHERLREHLKTFLEAYNFAKRLKTLRGRTVFEFITEKWTSERERFNSQPDHLFPGPNI